jgi:hypothetical protein
VRRPRPAVSQAPRPLPLPKPWRTRLWLSFFSHAPFAFIRFSICTSPPPLAPGRRPAVILVHEPARSSPSSSDLPNAKGSRVVSPPPPPPYARCPTLHLWHFCR